MGFETPLALLGLAAVVIPIAAHLMRRRDLPTVDLPTIDLLLRARAESRRRLRLVDLLLLIARVLFLVLLVLALSAPFVHARLSWGDGRQASVAIVIDDSMSMSRRAGTETALAEALARARSIVESLPEGSEVALVLAGAPARVAWPRSEDLDGASEKLTAVEGDTARGTDMAAAVSMAVRELAGAQHDQRQVVVLTDGASHAGLGEIERDELDVDVVLERFGNASATANRAVTSALAVPDPTTPGQASVQIEVRSYGGGEDTVQVALTHRGERLAERTIDIHGGVGRTVMHAPMRDSGDPTAEVVIDGTDALAVDDRRAVLLRPPIATSVLLVDGDPHESRSRDEVGYATRALEASNSTHPLSHRTVDASTLDTLDLTGTDVIVLANVPVPVAATAARLIEHVGAGGGLLIAAGDHVEPRAYWARMAELLPARPRAVDAPTPSVGLVTDGSDRIVRPGERGLGAVRTRRRLLLERPAPDSEVALSFTDGAPALVLGRHGEGRTALLATTLDDAWSDLPYRPGFLPLLVRLLEGISSRPQVRDEPVQPGAAVAVAPPPRASRMVVIDPKGDEHDIDVQDPRPFTHTAMAGAYRVLVATSAEPLADDPRSAFVVVPPAAESDLAPAPLPDLGERARAEGQSGATVRRPLAAWFFLAAGLMVVAEAVLRSRRLRTRR